MATRPDGGGLAYRSGRGAARASQLRKTEKERASAIAPPIPRTRPHFDSALPDRPAIVATPMGPRTSRPPEDDAAMDTIAAAAISHEQRDKLGALALDVLSRQAEARVLFAGREFVDKRASEHDVTRETAATAAGNLRTILERGPETAHERGLVAAFAVAGADARFEKADAEERKVLVDRFARHVDWLEAATPYEVWRLVDRVGSEPFARAFWDRVAQSIVDDAGERTRIAAARGRNAARLSALELANSDASRAALEKLAASRLDAVSAAVVSAVTGQAAPAPSTGKAHVRGRVRSPRSAGALRALALVTGYAIVAWMARGIGTLAGIRREAELSLGTTEIEIRERRFAFGRQIRERTDRVALSSILSIGREVRYPSMHLYVGAIALAIGILVGGTWIFEGARSGELVLLSIGAGLLLGGAILDLALDVLVPATRSRVLVELAVHRGRTVRIDEVALADADKFLDAVRAAR